MTAGHFCLKASKPFQNLNAQQQPSRPFMRVDLSSGSDGSIFSETFKPLASAGFHAAENRNERESEGFCLTRSRKLPPRTTEGDFCRWL